MIVFDQLQREIHLDTQPLRIVSLVPSQTELLADLGLEDNIVGVTKFCIHPPHIRKSARLVGGTKQVDFLKIKELLPDFILCNKEENTPEMVKELEKISPVYVSDVKDIEDATSLILQLGEIFQVRDRSRALVKSIIEELAKFTNLPKNPRRVVYFIWRKPWMAAGRDTFINSILELNNWKNLAENGDSRYPEIKLKDLEVIMPDLVLLSSEPFPFKDKHVSEIKAHYKGQTELVDGAYFSWYGSRLVLALQYFRDLQMKLSGSS